MRVLVCGGRDYRRRQDVDGFLGCALEGCRFGGGRLTVIEGGAPGADRFAREWAEANGVDVETFEADWSRGKRAGPERNARMLAEGKPDLVIAFPGGRGTADMVRRARAAGVEVVEVPR